MTELTKPVGKTQWRPLSAPLSCAFLLAAALCAGSPMQLQAQSAGQSAALSGVQQFLPFSHKKDWAERLASRSGAKQSVEEKDRSWRDIYNFLRTGKAPDAATIVWIRDEVESKRGTLIAVGTLIALLLTYLIAWIGESVYRRFFQKSDGEAASFRKS